MIKMTGGKKIDTIFVLIIFSVFALSVLMVLILGASIYKNMTDIKREDQGERSLLSYIWTKVKNGDKAESIHIGDFHGQSALYFDEEIVGIKYTTAIYQYEGWVYELFSEVGIDFLPEDGVQVMRINDLLFEEYEYGMIKVSTGSRSLLLYPRSGKAGERFDTAFMEGGLSDE